MAVDTNQEKLEQARRISNVGCIGVVIMLILLVLIGVVLVRADLTKKRNVAIEARGIIFENVVKAPGVMDRMLGYGCGTDAESAVEEFTEFIEGFDSETSITELEVAWNGMEDAWAKINRGCTEDLSDPAFTDMTTEMEGIRNRISVEKGNYLSGVDIYNSALKSFPASLVASGFEAL